MCKNQIRSINHLRKEIENSGKVEFYILHVGGHKEFFEITYESGAWEVYHLLSEESEYYMDDREFQKSERVLFEAIESRVFYRN